MERCIETGRTCDSRRLEHRRAWCTGVPPLGFEPAGDEVQGLVGHAVVEVKPWPPPLVSRSLRADLERGEFHPQLFGGLVRRRSKGSQQNQSSAANYIADACAAWPYLAAAPCLNTSAAAFVAFLQAQLKVDGRRNSGHNLEQARMPERNPQSALASHAGAQQCDLRGSTCARALIHSTHVRQRTTPAVICESNSSRFGRPTSWCRLRTN